MSPSFGMQPIFARDCRTCSQQIDEGTQQEDTENANLHGFENFAVCPGCHQEVPADLRTPRYLNRCLRHARRVAQRAEAQPSGSSPALTPTQLVAGAIKLAALDLSSAMVRHVSDLEVRFSPVDTALAAAPVVLPHQVLGWQAFLGLLAARHELSIERTIHAVVKDAITLAARALNIASDSAAIQRRFRQAIWYDIRCRRFGSSAANPREILHAVGRDAVADMFRHVDVVSATDLLLNRALEALVDYRAVFSRATQAGLR